MPKHNLFDKALSLIVEHTDDAPEESSAETPQMSDAEFKRMMSTDDQQTKATLSRFQSENAPPPPPVEKPKPVIADGAGNVNFAALYETASIPASPIPAEKCLELIASLPEGLPSAVKQQTVAISVQAMGAAVGATAGTIVADARAKGGAISQFMAANDADTASYISTAEAQILAWETKIAQMKDGISGVKARRERIGASCTAEVKRLHDVEGFFASSVAPIAPSVDFPPFPKF